MVDIATFNITVKTKGENDIIDITDDVQKILTNSGFVEGNIIVFAVGSTVGISTIEYEPGLLKDYPAFFEKIIPSNLHYKHNDTWNDGNGHSHIRASLQKGFYMVPFTNKNLILGTWQQIIVIEFDIRQRIREIVIQITGKKENMGEIND